MRQLVGRQPPGIATVPIFQIKKVRPRELKSSLLGVLVSGGGSWDWNPRYQAGTRPMIQGRLDPLRGTPHGGHVAVLRVFPPGNLDGHGLGSQGEGFTLPCLAPGPPRGTGLSDACTPPAGDVRPERLGRREQGRPGPGAPSQKPPGSWALTAGRFHAPNADGPPRGWGDSTQPQQTSGPSSAAGHQDGQSPLPTTTHLQGKKRQN